MKPFFVGEIRELINGKLIKGYDDLLITGVTYHPNMLNKTNMLLFFKTCRQKDLDVIKRYVPCAVVADKYLEELESIDGCTVISVGNVDTAYWKFVEHYRSLFNIPVIAVTGSSGKTTTKDMIKHILKKGRNVAATIKTANGRTRILNTLSKINEFTEAAVFETPVQHPGDLTYSCRLIKPTIGIITHIGIDHMEGCKTIENYIKAKSEMVTGIGSSGILIINADDENSKKIGLETSKGHIVYFGIQNPADFKGSDIKYVKNGMDFNLIFHQVKYHIFVPGYGEHLVYNALAALAAVHELGVGIMEGAGRLMTFERQPHQLQFMQGIGGSTIIDDTWNINPGSLRAAIHVLNAVSKGKKRGIIIGDIHELGDSAVKIHHDIGDMIVDMGGADFLITVGSLAYEIIKRAEERGLNCELYAFPSIEGIYDLLRTKLDLNTVLLIKYSGLRDSSILDLIEALRTQ